MQFESKRSSVGMISPLAMASRTESSAARADLLYGEHCYPSKVLKTDAPISIETGRNDDKCTWKSTLCRNKMRVENLDSILCLD